MKTICLRSVKKEFTVEIIRISGLVSVFTLLNE